MDRKAAAGTEHQTPPPRKPYRAPALIEYGEIRDLTRGKSGSISDGKSGMAKKM